MGNIWSKIWGSPTSCGIGWMANCTSCGMLAMECCCPCTGPEHKKCYYEFAWGGIILGGLIVLAVLADGLVGGEEGASLFDELAQYAEGALSTIYGLWKNTMGNIDNSLYNIFHDSLKASGALSKLVAHTATAGISLAILDWFSGVVGKLQGTCLNDIFNFINTPVTALKATLYNYNKYLGYLSDIFLIPVEFVVAIVALGLLGFWDVLKLSFSPISILICNIFQASGPCCK